MKENIIGAIAVIALFVAGVAWWNTGSHFPVPAKVYGAATAATGMLAENYIPYILYNNGYNSTKDIATTGNINGAIATFSSSATFGGNVTVTTVANATSSLTTGCLTTYATSSATPIKLQFSPINTAASSSQGATASGGFVVWGFGVCP